MSTPFATYFHSVPLFICIYLFAPRIFPHMLSKYLQLPSPFQHAIPERSHWVIASMGAFPCSSFFMRILLLNKMCASGVNMYLEKKISGDNCSEALQFLRLL